MNKAPSPLPASTEDPVSPSVRAGVPSSFSGKAGTTSRPRTRRNTTVCGWLLVKRTLSLAGGSRVIVFVTGSPGAISTSIDAGA